jgi:hypothetical protein
MNNTSLAIIQREELDTIQDAAKLLALSNYFDGKGNTPQAIAMIATKILAGREMGFGPFASVNGIHIISGKPSVGANLLAAAVKSSARYDYRVREMTTERCKIEFFERQGDKLESLGISEFTAADAIKAGTQNREKFPRNMYFARAMSNGVRWYCPDVFCGNAVYVPEELGAEVDGEGHIVDVVPRQVDQSTGEIVDSPVDNPFEEVDFSTAADDGAETAKRGPHPLASQSQLNRMHALGMAYYRTKENWEKKRPEWVREASGGAVTSSKDLAPEQIDWVITLLDRRIAKRQAQETEQPHANGVAVN